eukprot:SAG31_NODE_2892_length_4944_cov_1.454902_2_plen_352_part_00
MPKSSSEDLERRLEQLKKSRKGRKDRALGVRSNDRSLAAVPTPTPAAPPTEDNVADLLFDALDKNNDGVISKDEMVIALTQQPATSPPRPAHQPEEIADSDNLRLRDQVAALKQENAQAHGTIQDLSDQLDAERRNSRQKVAELEGLLKNVMEELAKQEGGASQEELLQTQEDMKTLEDELANMERRHAAELRRVRASVATNDSAAVEIEHLKKEKAARDIVMNQLEQELEELKQTVRPQTAAGLLASKSAVDPEALELTLRELDTAKQEIKQQNRRIEELEREKRNLGFEKDELLHEKNRLLSDHESHIESTKDEHGSQVRDLQSELVHVCNVLEAMEEKCKVRVFLRSH